MLQKEFGLKRGKTIRTFGAGIACPFKVNPSIEGAVFRQAGFVVEYPTQPMQDALGSIVLIRDLKVRGSARQKKLQLAR
jgi:hypothetical protein